MSHLNLCSILTDLGFKLYNIFFKYLFIYELKLFKI